MPKKFTDLQICNALRLLSRGEHPEDIAEDIGISYVTLKNYPNRYAHIIERLEVEPELSDSWIIEARVKTHRAEVQARKRAREQTRPEAEEAPREETSVQKSNLEQSLEDCQEENRLLRSYIADMHIDNLIEELKRNEGKKAR